MNATLLDKLVEAVLYEGYILYPYRASSKKNRQRFTFGRIYPHDYHVAQNGAEAWTMQTQCLVRKTSEAPVFDINVRFLQPIMREIARLDSSLEERTDDIDPQRLTVVPELQVDDQTFQTWQECTERNVSTTDQNLEGDAHSVPFSFPAIRIVEPLRNRQNQIVGAVIRRSEALEGAVDISTRPVDAEAFQITVRLLNRTPLSGSALGNESEVLMHTLASAHTILHTRGGEFLSLTDPPAEYQAAAKACKNIGCWPVLVGDEAKAERDTLLASPIILPDYPQIAPESAGTLFDGLEIDEILTLRIMTMTDEEKREMRGVDQHARALLERTESLGSEHLMKMHGTLRGLQPASNPFDDDIFGSATKPLQGVTLEGHYLRPGDSVRIHPKARADIMDMALAGKVAVIEAVEQDAEGKVHLALVLHDDPGRDLGMLRQPGHRFFYGLDEVEPITEDEEAVA